MQAGFPPIKTNIIIRGDALECLKCQIPDHAVDCVVTSPPYWALRDYHVAGQLGLESSFEEYLQKLLSLFDQVKRVLKPTGTCWVNLGDTYASTGMNNDGFNQRWHHKAYATNKQGLTDHHRPRRPKTDLAEKSLCLIPFRFALAMIQRGWLLRNVLIWHKPNALPSSVQDRFTVDFEYVFFFVQHKHYFFQPQYEPHQEVTRRRAECFIARGEHFDRRRHKYQPGHQQNPFQLLERIVRRGLNPAGRNKRCVWTIPTQPFAGAHFATFPEALIEPMILAGCPAFVCPQCAKPQPGMTGRQKAAVPKPANVAVRPGKRATQLLKTGPTANPTKTPLSFPGSPCPHCGCAAPFPSGIVLDPFFGSGTTGLVALKLHRQFIGIELNPDYVQMAKKRLKPLCKPLADNPSKQVRRPIPRRARRHKGAVIQAPKALGFPDDSLFRSGA